MLKFPSKFLYMNDEYRNYIISCFTEKLKRLGTVADQLPNALKTKNSKLDTDDISTAFKLMEDFFESELDIFDFVTNHRTKDNGNDLLVILNRELIRIEQNLVQILKEESFTNRLFGLDNVFSKYFEFILSEKDQINLEYMTKYLKPIVSIINFLVAKMNEIEIYQSYILTVFDIFYKFLDQIGDKHEYTEMFEASSQFISSFLDLDSSKLADEASLEKLLGIISSSSYPKLKDEVYSKIILKLAKIQEEVRQNRMKLIVFAINKLKRNSGEADVINAIFDLWLKFLPDIELDQELSIPVTTYTLDNPDFNSYINSKDTISIPTYKIPQLNELATNFVTEFRHFISSITNYQIYFELFIRKNLENNDELNIRLNKVILLFSYLIHPDPTDNLILSKGISSLITKQFFSIKYNKDAQSYLIYLLHKYYFQGNDIPEKISSIMDEDVVFYHLYPIFIDYIRPDNEKFEQFVKSSTNLLIKLAKLAMTNNFIYDYLRYLMLKYPNLIIPLKSNNEYFFVQLLEHRMLDNQKTFNDIVILSYSFNNILNNTIIKGFQSDDPNISNKMHKIIVNSYILTSNIDFDPDEIVKIAVEQAKIKGIQIEIVDLLAIWASSNSKYFTQIRKIKASSIIDLIDCDKKSDLIQHFTKLLCPDTSSIIYVPAAIQILIQLAKDTQNELKITNSFIEKGKNKANAEKLIAEGGFTFALENLMSCKEELLDPTIEFMQTLCVNEFTTAMFYKLYRTLEKIDFKFTDKIFNMFMNLVQQNLMQTDQWSFVFAKNKTCLIDESKDLKITENTKIEFMIYLNDHSLKYYYPLFSLKTNNDNNDLQILLEQISSGLGENEFKVHVKIGENYVNDQNDAPTIFSKKWTNLSIEFIDSQVILTIEGKSFSTNYSLVNSIEKIGIASNLITESSLDCSISEIKITKDQQIIRDYSPFFVKSDKIHNIDCEHYDLTAAFNGTISAAHNTIIDILRDADNLFTLVPMVQRYCEFSYNTKGTENIAVVFLKIFKILLDHFDDLSTEFNRKDYFSYIASYLTKLKLEFIDEDFLNAAIQLLYTNIADKVAAAFFLNIDFVEYIQNQFPNFITDYAMNAYNKVQKLFYNREAVMTYFAGALVKNMTEAIEFAKMLIINPDFDVDKSFIITYPMWYRDSIKLSDIQPILDNEQFVLFKKCENDIEVCFLPWLFMITFEDTEVQNICLDNFIKLFQKFNKVEEPNKNLQKIALIAALIMTYAPDGKYIDEKHKENLIMSPLTIPLLFKTFMNREKPTEALEWICKKLNDKTIVDIFVDCRHWCCFLLNFMRVSRTYDINPFILILKHHFNLVNDVFRAIEYFSIIENKQNMLDWESFEIDILKNIPTECMKGYIDNLLSVATPLIKLNYNLFSKQNKTFDYPFIEIIAIETEVSIRDYCARDETLIKLVLDAIEYYDGKQVNIFNESFEMIYLFIDILYEFSQIAEEEETLYYANKIIECMQYCPLGIQRQSISNLTRILSSLPDRIARYHNENILPVDYFTTKLDNNKFMKGLAKNIDKIGDNFKWYITKLEMRQKENQSPFEALLKSNLELAYKKYSDAYNTSLTLRGEKFHEHKINEILLKMRTNGSCMHDINEKPVFIISSFVNRRGGRSLMELDNTNGDIEQNFKQAKSNQTMVCSIKGIFSGQETITNYKQERPNQTTDNCSSYYKLTYEGASNKNNHFYEDLRIDEIEFIILRKYLEQDIACEIFSAYKPPLFMIHASKEKRDKFVDELDRLWIKSDKSRIPVINNKFDFFASLRKINQNHIVYNINNLPLLVKKLDIQSLWAGGKLSTFEYLNYLNILCGRSFNNMSAYPFFPWIFDDFDQMKKRDFGRANISDDKLKDYLQNDTTDIYGYMNLYHGLWNFYRLDPIYSAYKYFQNGLDYANRMFTKIIKTDKTECVPEYFSFYQFLVNRYNKKLWNNYDPNFVGDVILPNWAILQSANRFCNAKNFIELHKLFLEKDSSEFIHKWIDIMYGVNRGNKICGEFLHNKPTHEIENLYDSVWCPIAQLFDELHNHKNEMIDTTSQKDISSSGHDIIYFKKQLIISSNGEILYNGIKSDGCLVTRNIAGVSPNLNLIVYLNEKGSESYEPFVIVYDINEKTINYVCHVTSLVTTASVAGNRILLTGGNVGDVHIWSLPGRKEIKTMNYHTCEVKELAMSVDCGLICSVDVENTMIFANIQGDFITMISGVDVTKGLFVYKSGCVACLGESKIVVYDCIGTVISEIETAQIISARKCVLFSCIECVAIGIPYENQYAIKVYRITGQEISYLSQDNLESVEMFEVNKTGSMISNVFGSKVYRYQRTCENIFETLLSDNHDNYN